MEGARAGKSMTRGREKGWREGRDGEEGSLSGGRDGGGTLGEGGYGKVREKGGKEGQRRKVEGKMGGGREDTVYKWLFLRVVYFTNGPLFAISRILISRKTSVDQYL